MKRLVIIRHAKSDWANENLSDRERPLNKRGQRDAPFMAKKLKEKSFFPDEIISSPAARAFATAKYFASEFNISSNEILNEEELYSFNLFSIVEFLKTIPDENETVFIFSHNPSVTELVYFLTGKQVEMPTCAIAIIEIEKFSSINSICGKLIHYDFPKNYFK